MPNNSLIQLIPKLNNQRQICLVGAAVVDIVVDTPQLPTRGSDIELSEKGIHVGGCALNIAITLKRLEMTSLNLLPIGKGNWANVIEKAMTENDIVSHLKNDQADNGWCMALVEPDGERTFLSVSGVENQWSEQTLKAVDIEHNAIVYLSGYQLASNSGDTLVTWLETLPNSVDLFIDFGPRLADIQLTIMDRLFALKPIISLNRQEAEILGMEDKQSFTETWYKLRKCPLILRIDSDGALFCDHEQFGSVMPFETQVVDTIGAGDTHAGGVLAALASGWELPDAVLLGNAVASYVVSHRGGDCAPSKQAIFEYLAHY